MQYSELFLNREGMKTGIAFCIKQALDRLLGDVDSKPAPSKVKGAAAEIVPGINLSATRSGGATLVRWRLAITATRRGRTSIAPSF
jgi:hypothetical protein